MTMLTKNTDKLRGCLAKSDDPAINEATYGLPVMVQRIAERIFESLPADDAKAFFAALPDAVACDGKDLTKIGWQFLAAELRSLPEQPTEIQAVIDPVIAGMDLLASGQEWHADAAARAARAARAAWDAWDAWAADAAWVAAWAASDAAWAAAWAADWVADRAAARAAAWAADATVRLRQRDLLLRLIAEAPVMENHQ